MELTLKRDKLTKNAVRYADGQGHNIYLSKEEAATLLGDPEQVKVTIEAAV